jgi:CRP-like cAMP-binding protein
MFTEKRIDSFASAVQPRNGNELQNRILLSLSQEQLEDVITRMQLVPLTLHQVLCEAGQEMKSAYFVNRGVISMLAVQPAGKTVEVGLVGKEGFVGMSLLLGYRSSSTRLIVQGDGAAYACDSATLLDLTFQFPALALELQRFVYRLAMQTMQIAACNQLHNVEQKLARWILMTQDRIGSDPLPFTQAFLSDMLGTRRSSVTVSARDMQEAGLISYTRGNITVLDRGRLEEAACDCYRAVQKRLQEWELQIRPVAGMVAQL